MRKRRQESRKARSKRRRVVERLEVQAWWDDCYDCYEWWDDYYGDDEWYPDDEIHISDPAWSLDRPFWLAQLGALVYRRNVWERILDDDPFRVSPPPYRTRRLD